MITKERLEELIEKEEMVYKVDIFKNIEPYKLFQTMRIENNSVYCMAENNLHFDIEEVYETKAEAEWVAKMHTARTEYFEPPFELKDNEKYKFTTAKGGKMSISKFVYKSGEVQWWLSYVGTHRTFYSYQEAVEYARKLFEGEEV